MKTLFLPLLLTGSLLAECSLQQEEKAMEIWKQSIHKNNSQKLKLLNQAQKICDDLDVVYVDKLLIRTTNNTNIKNLKELKNRGNALALATEFHIHKWNIRKQTNQLFLKYFKQLQAKKSFVQDPNIAKNIQRLESQPKGNNVKAVTEIGGTYKADLLFSVGKFNIKDKQITQEIIDVIYQEVQLDDLALFGLEGGASSEGKTVANKLLSKNRGNALSKAILKQYPSYAKNIKVFAMGESQLVCEGDLLPEKDSKGEYQCLTKEDREKSRRVSIRRIK